MSNKNKVMIIAEVGVNHDGNLDKALRLIDEVKKTGADLIKFQTFKTENLVSKKANLAPYQRAKTKFNKQFDMLKKLELSKAEQKKIFNYCKKKKIDFISSPFDIESLNFLTSLNLKYIKIPSGEITNYPLLKAIGKMNKNIIMSTGMSNISEISTAMQILIKYGTKKNKINILHCTSSYPTPKYEVNLNCLKTLEKKFKINVGYSDHTIGDEVSIAAVALGAKIIEKHFTINKNSKGPDHDTSLNFKEFSNMVEKIRNVEISFGSKIKKLTKSEKKNLKFVRKSIYAKNNIKKGEIFNEENLVTKRPDLGISSIYWNKIIGKRAIKNFTKDEIIKI